MALERADTLELALLGELLDITRPHLQLASGELRGLRQHLRPAARPVPGMGAEHLDELLAADPDVLTLFVRPPARGKSRSRDDPLGLAPLDLPATQARVIGELNRAEALPSSHRMSLSLGCSALTEQNVTEHLKPCQ
jgi:hypothetical protein